MVLESQTTIKIGGKEIYDYKNLVLHQEIDKHHRIDLVLSLRNVEKGSLEPEPVAFAFDSKKFLGEKIILNINTKALMDTEKGLEFKGIVTQVRNVKGTSDYTKDEIHITAMSPTILLDNGPNYSSAKDMSLTELVDKAVLPFGDYFSDFELNLMDDAHVYYSVQSGESTFEYLSRLSKQYGEWFYYNGQKLVFGKPEQEEIALKRAIDLHSFDILMRPLSHNHKYYANDYIANEIVEIDNKELGAGVNGYAGFVNDKSKDLFTNQTKIWHNFGSELKVQETLEKNIEKQKKAAEINQLVLTGVSDNPCIKLGNIVVIENKKYRITKINHQDSKSGIYENTFEAVTAEFDSYPLTDIESFAKSDTQSAIVFDNEDPEELGRIMVQFPWQKESGTATQWIRIVTAHAGADKGFQFIPEIDEEVLIGFEGGNAERPHMVGSLYNGTAKADSWSRRNNEMKAIRTRSGHTIEFDDKDGEEKIKIYDNGGSIIIFDTKEKSLFINAAETIDMVARNINLAASENISLKAEGDITTLSEKDTTIQVEGETSIISEKDMKILSDTVISVSGKDEVNVDTKALKMEGKMTADLKSSQTTVQGNMSTVKGATGKVEVM